MDTQLWRTEDGGRMPIGLSNTCENSFTFWQEEEKACKDKEKGRNITKS